MCVRILNTDTQVTTDNPLEFAYMLGISIQDLPVDNNYKKLIPENCLCQVDIAKACRLSGYNYKETPDSSAEIEISKKTPTDIINEIHNNYIRHGS